MNAYLTPIEEHSPTDKCPKCGCLCDTYRDDDNRVEKSSCCGVWVYGDCEACNGEGYVNAAEYNCDWVNYNDNEEIVCPDCKGTGIEHSPFTPDDWIEA